MKKQHLFILAFIISFCAIIFIIGKTNKNYKIDLHSKPKEAKTQYKQANKNTTYYNRKIAKTAYTENSLSFLSDHTRDDVYSNTKISKTKVLEILDKYQGASHQTKDIYKSLQGSINIIYLDKTNLHFFIKNIAKSPTIAFLDEDAYTKSGLRAQRMLFAYRLNTNTVFGPNIRYPNVYLASMLYHELFHLFEDQKRKAQNKAQLRPGTKEYYKEEVEAYQLQSEIINFASNNKYNQFLDSIILKSGADKEGEYGKLHVALTPDDLKKVKQFFEIKNDGTIVAKSVLTLFYISLEFRLIDTFFRGNKQAKLLQKIMRYRAHIKK